MNGGVGGTRKAPIAEEEEDKDEVAFIDEGVTQGGLGEKAKDLTTHIFKTLAYILTIYVCK